jgi:hypothetical protein
LQARCVAQLKRESRIVLTAGDYRFYWQNPIKCASVFVMLAMRARRDDLQTILFPKVRGTIRYRTTIQFS